MLSERICSTMKIGCEIIQDLIPLFADGCASSSSAKLVGEHLEGCSECRAYASSYARASKISAAKSKKTREFDIDIELPYQHLAKKIRIRRRINTACTIGAVIAGAMALTFVADMYQKNK